jgi:hypothetical protein
MSRGRPVEALTLRDEEREIVRCVLLISRGDAAAVFDPVEEPLDAVPLAVEGRAEAGFPASI